MMPLKIILIDHKHYHLTSKGNERSIWNRMPDVRLILSLSGNRKVSLTSGLITTLFSVIDRTVPRCLPWLIASFQSHHRSVLSIGTFRIKAHVNLTSSQLVDALCAHDRIARDQRQVCKKMPCVDVQRRG